MEIQWIPIKFLKIADYNPREIRSPEIIHSIIETYRSKKIIKPLLVRKVSEEEYEVFDGGTRLEALKLLEVDSAPCIVYDCSRREAVEMAAIIHTNREELTPTEKGKFILRCINEDVWRNVEEASRELGFSKDTVYDWIREARVQSNDLWPRLKNIVNRDAKHALAMMPRPVRDKIMEELSTLRVEIIEKIKRDLPSILREIAEIAGELDSEEVVRDFRERVSKIVESGSGHYIKFKGFSGHVYEIEETGDNIVIRMSGRDLQIQRLNIPRIDLREFVKKLSSLLLK